MVSYCAYSSHPPNPAQSFFTQPTPDASQSVTRDARFSLGAPPKNDPSKLACSSIRSSLGQSKRACARYFFSPPVGRWEPPASCERCTAPLLRSLFGRWRDAMSEGPVRTKSGTDQVGGAKQQRHRAVSPLAEAVVTRPTSTLPRAQGLTRLILSTSGVRVRRAKETNSPCRLLPPLHFSFSLC